MSEEFAYKFTDKGLRVIIGAYEHALCYEPIDTSQMREKQLFKLFISMRDKADLENFPERKARWFDYMSNILNVSEIAGTN